MDNAEATLLVVDDNEENRDMLGRRLQRRGYTVLSAPDGESALELVENEDIDLILLDVMMPGIDGLEVLRRVREEHSAAELPVIMATARDQSEDVVAALDLGANDYVTKPIDFAVVSARVQKELRTRVVRRKKSEEKKADEGEDMRPGSILAGRYRLDKIVGKGNFGVVYRGHHLELDMPVAIKLLHAHVADGEALQRFRSEGRSAVRIRHPNAVTVYDFGVTDGGVAFLIMEFLEGEALSATLRRERRLMPQRVAEILTPVCDVLEAAHQKDLVHRDIKPENVYLQSTGSGEQAVKILDFGIAKLVGEHVARENLTAEGFVLGTPAYMAPERLRNQRYDGKSDVYSLGIMLFQLLSGRLPFPPDKSDPMALLMMHIKEKPPRLRSFAPELPTEFEDLVQLCLSKEPDPRPSAAELAKRFTALADALPAVDSNAPTHLIKSVTIEAADSSELPTDRLQTQEDSGWISRVLRRLRGGS